MKVLTIVGPTRTGKTDLAMWLAQRFNGELVSCDSRQVYQGMDIGTGKSGGRDVTKEKGRWIIGGIPIYLHDVVKPDKLFSVSEYYNLVYEVLKDLFQKQKLPILVGGTGFYIKAVLDGIDTLGVSPSLELRSQLKNLPSEELYEKLVELDPQKAKSLNPSDRKNPRRLIRAIEIALTIQNTKFKMKKVKISRKLTIRPLIIGLSSDRKIIYQKADSWIDEILSGGLLDEVRTLLKKGYKDTIPMQGIIYKSTVDFIEGEFEFSYLKEKLKSEMHDYIRRQITWFKKDKRISWFDIESKDYQKKIENLVQTWLNE